MINFDLNMNRQAQLENIVAQVIRRVNQHFLSGDGVKTVVEKSIGDEQINLDLDAVRLIFKNCKGTAIDTEEGSRIIKSSVLVVADPIDGSSEVNRAGQPYANPLSTAVMVIRGDQVIAAAAGSIWNKSVYGIDNNGLYYYHLNKGRSTKTYISITEASPGFNDHQIRLAAYARNAKRAGIARAIADLQENGIVAYFCNDGGGLYPLIVASGKDKSYNCAAELLPKELFEHITSIMATKAGAKLSRLDGKPLEIDSLVKQTSIVAMNDYLRQTLVEKLEPYYVQLKVNHVEDDKSSFQHAT